MADNEDDISLESLKIPDEYKKIGLAVFGAIVILTGITVMAYRYAKGRTGTTVLPGGTTYLGPGRDSTPTAVPPTQPSKFTVSSDITWSTQKGKNFPYSFSVPATLNLVFFNNGITDSIGIAWGNLKPENNIIFLISDLNKTEPQMAKYINQPKIEYVQNWWRQWSGLKGIKILEPFTNSKGRKGYKVKFINTAGESPNDDVFFEVPGRPDLMVRFGNGYLDKPVFDKIVDTFDWGSTPTKPTQ
jgi:hypothetical protein